MSGPCGHMSYDIFNFYFAKTIDSFDNNHILLNVYLKLTKNHY